MKQILIIIACVSFLLSATGTDLHSDSGIRDWQSITNKSTIEDIVDHEGLLICATNGGVLIFDKTNEKFVASYTNTEGLSDNHPVRVVVDNNGNWWFGMSNGDLNYFDRQTQKWQVFSDFKRFIIHDMVLHNDSLFVALDIGVSVFLLNKYEAKETYKNLGKFPVEIDALNSFIHWPYIWVGTEYGIAYADLTQINLKAPQSWENITTTDGLDSDKVKAVQYYQDGFFVGTESGVQRYQDGQWKTYSDLPDIEIVQFFTNQNNLYVALKNHIFKYRSDSDRWEYLVWLPKKFTALSVDEDGTIWLGTKNSGIVKWDPEIQESTEFVPNGPNGNRFADLTSDRTGHLWCASGLAGGFGVYSFDGGEWTNYSEENQDIPNDNTTSVVVDDQNTVWAGSWGGGVYRFSENKVQIYNAQNGYLAGIPQNLNYVVVNDICVDQTGTVWLTNYEAYNGKKLVAVTPDSQWIYFSRKDGILSTNPVCIAVDQNNWKWVGTEGGGIYVYNDNFTPKDKTDDQIMMYLDQADGLESNQISALTVDNYNSVWIGTDKGLNYYQGNSIFTKYGLITNDINEINVDPVGNIWVGTATGFSILSQENLKFKHYTKNNSPLAGENVLGITFDGETGMAYIGTTNGLSMYQTLFVEPEETVANLFVYPNPFEIGSSHSGSNLIIDELSRDCHVNIYSESGFLVRTLVSDSEGGRAVWDGKDDNDNFVASGIYLVVAAQQDGTSKSAKVAVIRQ